MPGEHLPICDIPVRRVVVRRLATPFACRASMPCVCEIVARVLAIRHRLACSFLWGDSLDDSPCACAARARFANTTSAPSARRCSALTIHRAQHGRHRPFHRRRRHLRRPQRCRRLRLRHLQHRQRRLSAPPSRRHRHRHHLRRRRRRHPRRPRAHHPRRHPHQPA